MKRTIELTRIAVDGDTVKYEIHDNTGLVCFGKKKWRLRYSSIMLMLSVLSRINCRSLYYFTHYALSASSNIFLPYRTHIVIHRQYSLS